MNEDISDSIYEVLSKYSQGLTVGLMAHYIEPDVCGNRYIELCYTIDRVASKMVNTGILTRTVKYGEPYYLLRIVR